MPEGTIQINTHFNFMQPAFRGRKTLITFDGGEPQEAKWGDTRHTVEAGEHTVHIEVLYAMHRKVAKASTTVDVGAGQTVSLKYRPPALVTMPGKITQVG